jgi:Predicted membrane protein/domain
VPPPGSGWAGGYGPPPVPLSPGGQPLAGFDKRLIAYLLDGLILGAISMVFVLPLYFCLIFLVVAPIATVNGEAVDSTAGAGIAFGTIAVVFLMLGLSLVIVYIYEVELALRNGGQTYGKKIANIRIVPLDPTETLTRRHLAVRFLARFGMNWVPGLGLVDGLYQLWDKPYQQCLHDKAAKTVVVRLTA